MFCISHFRVSARLGSFCAHRTVLNRAIPATITESVAHDESDVLFGIDLRRWSEGGWSSLHGGTQNKPLVPPVLTTLLDGLTQAYPELQNDVGESAVLLALEYIVTVVHRETQGLDL
jgi:hypothetical protein